MNLIVRFKRIGLGVVLVFVVAVALFLFLEPEPFAVDEFSVASSPSSTIPEFVVQDDPLDAIAAALVTGGPAKDGIPALDAPTYVTNPHLDDDATVFGIVVGSQARAYPQNIMYWHEIVNDEVGSEMLSVTYCPLTGSVIAYRDVNLGVSGALYNSNLVMYDRATDSLWPQILGQAVVGARKADVLDTYPVVVTTWGQWKALYPHTLVLSEDTGYDRDYNRSPYPGYEQMLRVWFPVAAESDALRSKAIVVGVEVDGSYLAIPKEKFEGVREYVLDGVPLTISYNDALDVVTVFREDTREDVATFEVYWFAWYAYHPTTEILN